MPTTLFNLHDAANSWYKFYKQWALLNPKEASEDFNAMAAAQNLREEIEQELDPSETYITSQEIKNKLDISQKQKTGPEINALLEVFSILQERLDFNNSILECLNHAPEPIAAAVISSILGLPKNTYANATRLQLKFDNEEGFITDRDMYLDLKNFIIASSAKPSLVELVYHQVYALFEKERDSTTSQQKGNPNLEFMYLQRSVTLLEPFLKKAYIEFNKRCTKNGGGHMTWLLADTYTIVLEYAKNFDLESSNLKKKVQRCSLYLSILFKEHLDSAIEKMTKSSQSTIKQINELIEKNKKDFPATENNMTFYKKINFLQQQLRGPAFRTSETAKISQRKSHTSSSSFDNLTIEDASSTMIPLQNIIGPVKAREIMHEVLGSFYTVFDFFEELKGFERELESAINDSKKSFFKNAPSSYKAPFNASSTSNSSSTINSPTTITVEVKNNADASLLPDEKLTSRMLEIERESRDNMLAIRLQEEYDNYLIQRDLNLTAYRHSVEVGRKQREEAEKSKRSLIVEELSSLDTIQDSKGRNENNSSVSSDSGDTSLQTFEIEQLTYLSTICPNLIETLQKWSQEKTISYSELEKIVTKMSKDIYEGRRHPGNPLILPGPHFTMRLPNTRKLWGRTEDRYDLSPQQLSTLNSWKGLKGNHAEDILSDWARDRCLTAFFEKAGINVKRLETALSLKRNLQDQLDKKESKNRKNY